MLDSVLTYLPSPYVCLILTGLIWGVTNPLLKRGVVGIDQITEPHPVKKILKEIVYLVTKLNYICPFIFNQLGSLLYYVTLPRADLSLAYPMTNSVSFVSTSIVGFILGEGKPKMRTFIGMFLVLSGITCYILQGT